MWKGACSSDSHWKKETAVNRVASLTKCEREALMIQKHWSEPVEQPLLTAQELAHLSAVGTRAARRLSAGPHASSARDVMHCVKSYARARDCSFCWASVSSRSTWFVGEKWEYLVYADHVVEHSVINDESQQYSNVAGTPGADRILCPRPGPAPTCVPGIGREPVVHLPTLQSAEEPPQLTYNDLGNSTVKCNHDIRRNLNLTTSELRRLHYDLAMCYKIIFNIVNMECADFFVVNTVSFTRGHPYKLYVNHCRYNVRRNFFRLSYC